MVEYELVLSRRKTIVIYVRPDGRVEVRGPLRLSRAKADAFVKAKAEWILKAQKQQAERCKKQNQISLSKEEVEKYKHEAASLFQARCKYFAEKMGVRYKSIKVGQAKTRWGSCSNQGNLNFTFRLLFAPGDLIDYVVVHELAHLKELNHSAKFWAVVGETLPDYKERRRLLKAFGQQVEWVIE